MFGLKANEGKGFDVNQESRFALVYPSGETAESAFRQNIFTKFLSRKGQKPQERLLQNILNSGYAEALLISKGSHLGVSDISGVDFDLVFSDNVFHCRISLKSKRGRVNIFDLDHIIHSREIGRYFTKEEREELVDRFWRGIDDEAKRDLVKWAVAEFLRENKYRLAGQYLQELKNDVESGRFDVSIDYYFGGLRVDRRRKKESGDAAMPGSVEGDAAEENKTDNFFEKEDLNKGGIDLNPSNLELNVHGDKSKINFDVQLIHEYISADGFVPVIINVSPVSNAVISSFE